MIAEARPICVWGAGRSGTSWLAKIIESAGGFRYFFEPLHPQNVPEAAAFQRPFYVRPGSTSPQLCDFLDRLFDGRVDNDWMAHARDPDSRGTRPLVKCIRMNLMLDWVVTTFDVSGCFIVRHPYSAVASTLRLGWGTHLGAFLDHTELMHDHLEPYEPVMRSAQTPVEMRSVAWAVSTKLALESSARHGIPVVKYEALCRNPEDESRRIFQSLGLPWHDGVSRFIRETSSQHKGGNFAIFRNSSEMGDWETALSPQHAREVASVCRSFGLDLHDW